MVRSPAILRPDAYIPCQPQHTAAQPADLAGRGGRRDEQRVDRSAKPDYEPGAVLRMAPPLPGHRRGDLRRPLHDLRAARPPRPVRQGGLPATERLGDGGVAPGESTGWLLRTRLRR